jgi:hypothetical protein
MHFLYAYVRANQEDFKLNRYEAILTNGEVCVYGFDSIFYRILLTLATIIQCQMIKFAFLKIQR